MLHHLMPDYTPGALQVLFQHIARSARPLTIEQLAQAGQNIAGVPLHA